MNTTPPLDPKSHAGSLKPQLQLIPPVIEEEMSKALNLGAGKYGPWNWWDSKVEVMTYIGAIRRHIGKFLGGEDHDEEGLHHLGCIAASCAIVLDAGKHGSLVDNRPSKKRVEERIRDSFIQAADDLSEETRQAGRVRREREMKEHIESLEEAGRQSGIQWEKDRAKEWEEKCRAEYTRLAESKNAECLTQEVKHSADNDEAMEKLAGMNPPKMYHTKPPLGLRPRFIMVEQRIEEIQSAIQRYREVNKEIPKEWRDELNALMFEKINRDGGLETLWQYCEDAKIPE